MKKDRRDWQDADHAGERLKRNLTIGAVVLAIVAAWKLGEWLWERIF
ncbi:hypothetical protein [Rufibacter soli]